MENQEPEENVVSDAESSSVNQRSTVEYYAVNFVNLVNRMFEHQPETRSKFVELMRDFKNYRISPDCLIFGVHLLFKEHKELLKRFNDKFVPEKYKGCFGLRGLDFGDVRAFVQKVQSRFSQEPNVSNSFLEILNNYTTGTYDRADTFVEISKLFEGHRDLLMEYWKFLPPII